MGVRIDGSNDVISAADGSLTVDGLSLSVTGIITASGGFKVGSAYTAFSNGNVETTGIITTSSGLNVTGGELGIGTDSPDAKTHIDSGSSNTPLIVEASGTNRSRIVFKNNTETGTQCNIELFDDDLRFVTNSGERFRIDADGRLLVGTNASQAHAGANLLEIGNYTLTNAGITINNPTNGAGLINFGDSSSSNRRGRIEYTHVNDAFRLYTADAERVRIDSSGQVGLGTTAPVRKLHLHEDSSSNSLIQFTNSTTGSTSGDGSVIGLDSDESLLISNKESGGMFFHTSNTSRAYFSSGGTFALVGGGSVASPAVSLNGSAGSDSMILDANGRLIVGRSAARTNWNDSSIEPKIVVEGAGDNDSTALCVVSNSGSTSGASRGALLTLARTKGTSTGSNTAVDENTAIGIIEFKGNDGTSFTTAAKILAQVDGTPGTDDMPGRLIFSTTADGAAVPTERMRINSSGRLLINNTNEVGNYPLQVTAASDANAIVIIGRSSDDIGELSFYENDRTTVLGELQYRQDHLNFRHRVGDIRFATGGTTERGRIDSSGRFLIGDTLTSRTVGGINCHLHVEGTNANGSSLALVRNTNGATTPPYLFFGRTRSGSTGGTTAVQSGDLLGYLAWNGSDGNDLDGSAANIQAVVDGTPGSNDMPGRLEFATTRDGANSPTIAMGINRNGELRMGYNNSDPVSTDQAHSIGDPSLDTVTTNLARLVMQERSGNWISFKDGSGTHYGTISRNGGNVTYGGQASDYRIKENVVGVSTGIDTLKRLRPVHFNYTSDSGFTAEEQAVNRIGFIAHEYAEVCSDGVIGEKDGYDILGNCVNDTTGKTTQHFVYESQAKDGETWTETSREPKYQQIDFSKAVPVLTAALQEAITKIETLETRIAALEGG